MLKLWGRTNSINVMKVIWTLEELKLPYERINAGMQYGVVTEDFYGKMTPTRRVPTIEDDGFTLFESNAIVRYLAAKKGEAPFWPADLKARADSDRWMDWASMFLGPAMTPVFWQLIRTPAEKRSQQAIDEGIKATESTIVHLEPLLAARPCVGGDALTIGDISVGVYVHRWFALPIQRQPLPAVEAYYQRLLARPAYKQHVATALS